MRGIFAHAGGRVHAGPEPGPDSGRPAGGRIATVTESSGPVQPAGPQRSASPVPSSSPGQPARGETLVLPYGEAAIEAAAGALRRGEVVGIPTDTVYGLAVDPFQAGGAGRIFAAKGRPRTVTLPVLVSGTEQAVALAADVTPVARRLMDRWWPGALTVVVSRRAGLGADIGDELDSIGLRCADHPLPLALAALVGPIATTSANRHGEAPITTASELASSLTGVALVVDGGPCEGTPSTVVDCRGGDVRLLRAGRIPWDLLISSVGS
jgi:L-threonylcarbamoyladenylate synthase